MRMQPERVTPTLSQHAGRPVPMMSRIVRDHRAVIAPQPAANVQIRNTAMRAAVVSPAAAARPVTVSATASSLQNLGAMSFYVCPRHRAHLHQRRRRPRLSFRTSRFMSWHSYAKPCRNALIQTLLCNGSRSDAMDNTNCSTK
jgi:hypothetical protein